MALGATAGAQTAFDWNGGTGNWSTGTNWAGGSVPNSLNADVLIDNGDGTNSSVTLSTQSAIVGRLTINVGDTLTVTDAVSGAHTAPIFYVAPGGFTGSGVILNNGTLKIAPGTGNLKMQFGDSSQDQVTLNGSGTLIMEDSAATSIAGFAPGTATAATFINNSTIAGAGLFNGELVNTGSITATSTTNALKISAVTARNTGTLAATGGATLLLNVTGGAGASTVATAGLFNAGGVIRADGPGSVVSLEDVGNGVARLHGGTLMTTNGGVIRIVGTSSILDGSVSPITIAAGSDVRIGPSANTGPDAIGTIIINGTLTMNGNAGGANRWQIASLAESGASPFLTLNGSGTVQMTNSANNIINGVAGGLFTTNIPIIGGGQIGANSIDVVNNSTITASGSAGLVLDPSTTFTNTNTIRAIGGATLTLNNGNYENAAGTFRAEDDSSFILLGGAAEVRGGLLSSTGSGEVRFSNLSRINGSSSPVTISGVGRISNTATSTWLGTVQVDGTVFLDSTGSQTGIGAGSLILNGSGNITMSNNANNRIGYGGTGTTTLVNNMLIQGTGNIGGNSLNITNSGTILANQTVALTIDPVSTFVNNASGVLRAIAPGGIVLNTGAYTNNGLIEANEGTVTGLAAVNFTNYASGSKTLTGGTWRAIGTGAISISNITQVVNNAAQVELDGNASGFLPINFLANNSGSLTLRNDRNLNTGALANSGTIHVDGTSILAVGGGLTVSGNSSDLLFDINTLAPYDAMAVTGPASLDGTLHFTLASGLEALLTGNETITLLTAGSPIAGAFDNVANGERMEALSGIGSFQVNYGPGSSFDPNSIVLSQYVPEPSQVTALGLGIVTLCLRRVRREPTIRALGHSS
jgi:hypothetical protein